MPTTVSSDPAGTILLIGASRGLGHAMAAEFLKKGWNVVGTVRGGRNRTMLHDLADAYKDRVEIEILDICEPDQLAALHDRLSGRMFDMLFVNAGVTNNEKETIGDVTTDEFVRVMVTNSLSPMRVLESLEQYVPATGTIGVMSSGQGSISNNETGMREVYRGSKAALNMFMRSFAARHAGTPRAMVVMAPGWVRTEMGGPDARLTIEESVPNLVNVLFSKRGRPGLEYLDYLGRTVPGEVVAVMKLIGIEEHFLTAEVREAWNAIGLEASDPSVAFHSSAIEKRLIDLAEERLALMDESGLDVQVLSLTTPALHDLGPQAVELARRINDAVAKAAARHPDRFQALATLPVAMPDEAALELDRCIRTLDFKGTMLCGRVGARNLDHPDFSPIFRCADSLNAPILLHPRTPDIAVRTAYYSGFGPEVDAAFSTYGLGWHYDAGVQFVRLVLAGTFDRMPGLQVILGHWGELVLFYAERLAAMDRVAGLAHPIATYLRRNLYVTASGMFLPHFLERAVAVVGADRLLFSTDFPYQYRPGHDARRFLEKCGLDETAKAGFAYGNWVRLTRGCTMEGGRR